MLNANRQHPAGARYRPDIDGLRAIAVLPVVFYHYRIWPFSGGYVGVDVFFVISGYLITTLIHAELAERRFSIWNFYERRARRILPALFVVLAGANVGALIFQFPHQLIEYAKSLLATAGFISNFQFWSEAGYFDAIEATKPLLHTWSLAVEEQFYLIFPWLLFWLRNRSVRGQAGWLAGVLAASLVLSVVGVVLWPIASFFLLPARFWELMIGAVLALEVIRPPEHSLARNALAVAGIAAIGWSVFALDAHSAFPGANALAPCLGAAALILAGMGGTTFVNRALATRAPVLIGLISYSLYLWHWPLYVFARSQAPDGLDWTWTGGLIAASFALAGLTWRFIEQPFRLRRLGAMRGRLFAYAGAGVLVSAIVGAVMWSGAGLPGRYSPAVERILAASQEFEPRLNDCFSIDPGDVSASRLCKIGVPAAAPYFLLWGDSHADAMLPAVAVTARQHGKAGLFAGHGRCPPLVGAARPDTRECKPFNDAVLKVALASNIALVILDARWSKDIGEAPRSVEAEPPAVFIDARSKTRSPAETRAVFARSLARTVRILTRAGKRVVIVASVPEFTMPVPQALARMMLTGNREEIAPTRRWYLAHDAPVRAVFAAIANRYPITFVYPDAILCPKGRCKDEMAGHPLYRDAHHLTVFGAEQLAPLFAPLFAASRSP